MTGLIVLAKISTLFLLIAVGWAARRRGYLSAETASALGRFVVDISLPALVFSQMISTVDRSSLREDWVSFALGGLVMLLALVTGWALAYPVVRNPASRPTFAFLVGVPNWIYLPLPIAQELYGSAGVRAVLVCNISAQLLLWTLGVAILRGQLLSGKAIRHALLNPGVLASFIGIAVALLFPQARGWSGPSTQFNPSVGPLVVRILMDSLNMLGGLTVPLSLLIIGLQLGEMNLKEARSAQGLPTLLLGRLLLGPLVTVAVIRGLMALGWTIPDIPRQVVYLIATMPIAVSCNVFAERFGGDTPLSARAIFYSTLVSVVSVPAVFSILRALQL